MRIQFLPITCAVALLTVVPPAAQAQMLFNGPSSLGGSGGGGGKPQGGAPPSKPDQPPALPGAASTNTAAPANHGPIDMEPTDALFDAINRGDIGSVRDAISRGADLHGQNVLGLTPLELSVDLGRNDISFLLLSMRGADDGRARQQPTTTAAKPPTSKQARQTPPHPNARVAAPAPAQTPRLFAGDGGTPNPNAGFLGFGQR